jgi:diketogulonate reductase-like aldo/keto reductase
MPVMAYSPLGQGALLRKRSLVAIARNLGATPAQVALRWVMRSPDVIAIPESANAEHVRANRDALSVVLDPATLQAIDAAFPPPTRATPLAVI